MNSDSLFLSNSFACCKINHFSINLGNESRFHTLLVHLESLKIQIQAIAYFPFYKYHIHKISTLYYVRQD